MTEPTMTASEVLAALRRAHPQSALIAELQIGDDLAGEGTPQVRRIDALMFQGLQRTAFEIKVSRADVANETWAKVTPWRRVTHRFIYAVPAGLIERPPLHGTGLWWVHPDGRVEVRRKVTINNFPEPLPQRVVQALAYRLAGVSSIRPQTVDGGSACDEGTEEVAS